MSRTFRNRPVVNVVSAMASALVMVSASHMAAGDHSRGPEGADLGFARDGGVVVAADEGTDSPASWRRLLYERRGLLNEIDTIATPIRAGSRAMNRAASECVLDARHLPHTADAIEAWFHNCRRVPARLSR